MSGPTNKANNPGERAERFEHLALWAGLIVFVGLLVESGPELSHSIITLECPPRGVLGSFLVAIGVFAEVLFSWRAVNEARKADLESEQRVVELGAETERLRKENNEFAALLSYRNIGDPQELAYAMKRFAGTRFVFGVGGGEARNLLAQLGEALRQAEWIKIGPPRRGSEAGWGVEIVTVGDSASLMNEGALALAEWLDSHGIGVVPMIAQRDDIEPGTVVITIGPKPETLEQQRILQETYALRTSGPVTPPKA
jgi:hypothetical protein